MISQPASHVCGLILITVAMSGIAGCASHDIAPGSAKSVTRTASKSTPTHVGDRAVAFAVDMVGTPYRYGGSSPSGFDCSGLVYYSYAQAGKSVPRTTGQLSNGVIPVARADLRAGDVLFFNVAGKMSHVGLYLGNKRFVHAPSTGKVVSIETLESDFYSDAFIRAGRPR